MVKRPNVVGLVCYYDFSPCRTKVALQLLSRLTDTIIAIDGRFCGYGNESHSGDFSNPQVCGIVSHYAIDITDSYRNLVPYVSEVQKRTLLLLAADQVAADWVLIADVDEFFFGDLNKLTRELRLTDQQVLYCEELKLNGHAVYRPRLIRYSADLHYKNNHSEIHDINGLIHGRTTNEKNKMSHLKFLHASELHTKYYKRMRSEWLKERDRARQEGREW